MYRYMAPKKKVASDTVESSRQRTTRATGLAPHTPEFYWFTVRHEVSRDFFAILSKMGMEATQLVDRVTLESLRVWSDIALFFNSISWGHVLSLNFPTYEALTLEILCTLVFYLEQHND